MYLRRLYSKGLADLFFLISSSSCSISIGDHNIIEDHVTICGNSCIGHGNIIEVHSTIEGSIIGDFNRISARASIRGSSVIGNGCIIGPGLVLDGVSIPDNTAVYAVNGSGSGNGNGNGSHWRCGPADNSITYPLGEAMRSALLDSKSPQCLTNFFQQKSTSSSSSSSSSRGGSSI